MAKKSRRLFLEIEDISKEDQGLMIARLEGTLTMSSSEIVGSEPGVISKAVSDDHKEVVQRSIQKWRSSDE